MDNERRLKLVMVEPRAMLALFNVDASEFISVPKFEKLPAGYSVVGVWYDYAYAAFAVTVHHPDFPEVEPGYLIPVLTGMTMTVEMRPVPKQPARGIAFCNENGVLNLSGDWDNPPASAVKVPDGCDVAQVSYQSGDCSQLGIVGETLVFEITGVGDNGSPAGEAAAEPLKPARKGKWEFLGAP